MPVSKRLVTALLPIWMVCSSVLFGQSLRNPEFMREARASFESIYNLDYGRAAQDLTSLRQRYPEHPAPPLYLAVVRWLRELFRREELDLDRFVAPGYFKDKTQRRMPEADRKAFFDFIKESRQKAQTLLDQKPGHKDARYFMGATYAIEGSFTITIDRSVRGAFSHGKKAYAYHRKLVNEDPEYYDAYMSVGVYEYIVGNLPWYVKWLATIVGYRGSEKQGFEYLARAAEHGEYVRDDAQTLQMVLFIREEKLPMALANARVLHSKYPRNYLLHINQAQILEMMKKNDEAAQTYRDVLSAAEQGRGNYGNLPISEFRYKVGRRLEKMDRDEGALAEYRKILKDSGSTDKTRALSHLQTALILERRTEFSAALDHYQSVLKVPPYGSSHVVATRRMKALQKKMSREGG